MAPSNIKKARSSTMSKPVVRSATATQQLALSLRRLGADDETIAKLTGQGEVRPASR